MCDEGRFDYAYINSVERFAAPLAKKDDQLSESKWEFLMPTLRRELSEAVTRNPDRVAAVLSPFLTCEEAYLLARYFKDQAKEARLFLGPVPVIGADDTFPKDRKGRPVQPVKFTIHAEKCPNRRGVEEVLRHFQGGVLDFDTLLGEAREGKLTTVFLTAGYPPRQHHWISPEQAEALTGVNLLVVQDLFPSPASIFAKYVLPAATYAEKDGTFVNQANLAQSLRRAVRPERQTRTDGQIFMELAQRRGLFHAQTLRKMLAAEVPYFAPLAGDLGGLGIRLGKSS
jgi:NADH-quinone oxidoreductase subunit G